MSEKENLKMKMSRFLGSKINRYHNLHKKSQSPENQIFPGDLISKIQKSISEVFLLLLM